MTIHYGNPDRATLDGPDILVAGTLRGDNHYEVHIQFRGQEYPLVLSPEDAAMAGVNLIQMAAMGQVIGALARTLGDMPVAAFKDPAYIQTFIEDVLRHMSDNPLVGREVTSTA